MLYKFSQIQNRILLTILILINVRLIVKKGYVRVIKEMVVGLVTRG